MRSCIPLQQLLLKHKLIYGFGGEDRE